MLHFDVVVVGAGAAGIAAGRALQHAGARYVVLEAAGRIGGRALTDLSLGVPIDLGCTWLHSADENVLADTKGVRFGEDLEPYYLYLDDEKRWATASEQASIRAYIDECEAKLIDTGRRGFDPSTDEVVGQASPYRPHFDWWCGAYTSATADRVGAMDWARYRDTGQNWTVESGYGALIASRAIGINILRETPATMIETLPGGAQRIQTPAGRLTAETVVITASTAAMERIRFEPALPDWKRDALERLPLGRANKVALRFDSIDPDWSDGRNTKMSMRMGRWGKPVVEVFMDAAHAQQWEPGGESAQIEFVLNELNTIFGSTVRKRFKAGRASCWGNAPWIWGAYSATTPGGGDPRADLAKPLDGRVFFAGEATHPHFFSTAHGAWESGMRAAQEALEIISNKR